MTPGVLRTSQQLRRRAVGTYPPRPPARDSAATRTLPLTRAPRRVRRPVASGISKWVSGYTSQDVCPWNDKFASPLREEVFRPREALAGKDVRTFARSVLELSQEEFSRAFKGSPMKRAKLRGLTRNAVVALGNVGTAEDVDVLTRALSDPEPLVREHAAWALGRLDATTSGE